MKIRSIKYAGRKYRVYETAEVCGCVMVKIKDEPNHYDWVSNYEVLTHY